MLVTAMVSSSKRIGAAVVAAACLTACGAAAGMPAAHTAAVAPRDAFTGTVAGGNGRYTRPNGRLEIALAPTGSAATRPLRITLTGTRCGARARCLRLTGTVHGTIARRLGGIPDVGQSFTIAASGTISPLGRVSISGTAHGTGNIMYGHESMTLKLSDAKGSVTVSAASGRVPGFTSP
jgi:hypothetical protein